MVNSEKKQKNYMSIGFYLIIALIAYSALNATYIPESGERIIVLEWIKIFLAHR